MMWSRFLGINSKRINLLNQVRPGALYDFYSVPFPESKSSVKDVDFIALDFETTGLDIQNDHVISVGLVEISQLGIKLASAWHEIIKTEKTLPEQSTVIHKITDDMLLQGEGLRTVLDKIITHLKGHILVAHHAQLELGFLNRLCADIYDTEFIIPTIDTQFLAKRQLLRNQVALEENSLRLFNLRERYKLPAYKAHNALYDALSTAELFLVLVSELYPNLDCRLKDLLIKK